MLASLVRSAGDGSSAGCAAGPATGTTAGDHQELLGLSEVFYGAHQPHRSIPIGSVKSNMGHAEGASGLMSVIKCVLMYEKKVLLPNNNFERTSHAPLLDGAGRSKHRAASSSPAALPSSHSSVQRRASALAVTRALYLAWLRKASDHLGGRGPTCTSPRKKAKASSSTTNLSLGKFLTMMLALLSKSCSFFLLSTIYLPLID